MATQTQTQRKATGQKAAATRRRNAAKRKRSAQQAAETRARAEMNTLQSLAHKGQDVGQRAVDLTVGAAAQTRDRVTEATRSVATATGRERLARNVRSSVRDTQRRGARARKGAQRSTRTRAKSVRRDAERRVKSLRS